MSSVRPAGCRYLKTHEWARQDDAGHVTVGISDHAVEMLNREIVYVELPKVGKAVKAGQSFGTIESVKAASDLYAPVSGTIAEINGALADNPALVADEPFAGGWMIKIAPADPAAFDGLLDDEAYAAVVAAEGAH